MVKLFLKLTIIFSLRTGYHQISDIRYINFIMLLLGNALTCLPDSLGKLVKLKLLDASIYRILQDIRTFRHIFKI